jgi:hypothetical protein
MPVVATLTQNLRCRPAQVLADAGYWSEANVAALETKGSSRSSPPGGGSKRTRCP